LPEKRESLAKREKMRCWRLRQPGRGERNCIAKPALPSLDPPLSPALGVGMPAALCLAAGLGVAPVGEQWHRSELRASQNYPGVKKRGAVGMSLPFTYQRSVPSPRILFRVPEHTPQLGRKESNSILD
jgi:hypothetical protein